MGTKGLLACAALLAALAGYWLLQGGDGSRTELARAEVRGAPIAAAQAGDGQASKGSAGAARAAEREVVTSPAAARPALDEVLLYGAVTDVTDRAVELASLGVEGATGATRYAERSSAGAYALAGLAPGRYTLRASATGFVTRREELTLRADEEHQRHDLVLEPALTIPVRIVDENGESLARFGQEQRNFSLDVVATRAKPEHGLCGMRGEPGSLYGCGTFEGLVNQRGEVIPDLPAGCAGMLRLCVEPPVFVSVILRDAVLATQRVDGPVDELLFEFERASLERQLGGVRARFVDALTGAPILGGRASLDPPSRYSTGGGDVVPGAPAEFAFDGRAPGLHTLRFFHPSYADTWQSVRVPAGSLAELGDVPVSGRATIRGTVVDAHGTPVSATVRCAPLSSLRTPADDPGMMTSAQGGRFELRAARARLHLLAMPSGYALLAQTVDSSGGDVDDVVLRLEEGVAVALVCAGDALGRQLTLADASGVPLLTWSAGDYTIRTRLAAGRYQLWTGVAERVDAVEELVVGSEPLTRTISFE